MATADPYQDLDPRLARALRDLRQELDERLAALRGELGLAPGAGAARPAAPDYGALLEIVRHLDEADDQAELLGRMLEGAGRFAERSLFLLVRGDEVEGWGGLGLPAEAAAAVRAKTADHGALSRCIEHRETVPLSAPECAALLGAHDGNGKPVEGVVVPFTLRGRVAAVLYADRSETRELTAPALQLLAYTTANILETLPLRRAVPADSAPMETVEVDTRELLPATELEAEPVPEEVRDAEPEPQPEPQPEAEPETEEPDLWETASTEPEPDSEPEPEPEPEPDSEPEAEAPATEAAAEADAEPAIDPHRTVAIPRTTVEVADPAATEKLPEPPVAPADPPFPRRMRREAMPGVDDLGERGDGIEVAPPPDLEGPGWAFRERQPSPDEGRHEEARRLARLLVTEIKLYNEEQVEEGLERGDLYSTLQEEIDRSKRIFEERIPAEVRAQADYFREELVRILADGDASVLGR
ncbi:MAG: GAF domain-containing protein [Thermoanaerobaculia bacterium]